jgi:hypothetical protein
MPYSISTLLLRNLSDVFGENDPARRRTAIDEIFREGLEMSIDSRSTRAIDAAAGPRHRSARSRAATKCLVRVSGRRPLQIQY